MNENISQPSTKSQTDDQKTATVHTTEPPHAVHTGVYPNRIHDSMCTLVSGNVQSAHPLQPNLKPTGWGGWGGGDHCLLSVPWSSLTTPLTLCTKQTQQCSASSPQKRIPYHFSHHFRHIISSPSHTAFLPPAYPLLQCNAVYTPFVSTPSSKSEGTHPAPRSVNGRSEEIGVSRSGRKELPIACSAPSVSG